MVVLLKIKQFGFALQLCFQKMQGEGQNSVNPGQTAPSAMFD